jgi:hypothetical protein
VDLWIRVLKLETDKHRHTETQRHRIFEEPSCGLLHRQIEDCGESSQTCAEEFGSQKWRKSDPRRRR